MIEPKDGYKVGKLKKIHNGFYNECCTNGDLYRFQYPANGEAEKAIFLAAVHFIDQMWFEQDFLI